MLWNVREETAGIDVDGVATGRLEDGNANTIKLIGKVGGLMKAIAKVLFLDSG